MKFHAKDWDFLYTENRDGTCDLLIYNPETEELYTEEAVEKTYVNGKDSYGQPYVGACLSRKSFDLIYDALLRDSGGAQSDFFTEEGPAEKDTRERIPRERMEKALRAELSQEELDSLLQKSPETADYYDFETLRGGIFRFLRGEISADYYTAWLIAAAMALDKNPFPQDSKRQRLYSALSYCFDGHSFDDPEAKENAACYEMLAYLSFYDHLLKNTRKEKAPPFYNEGKLAVYVCFDYCNHHNVHYRLCVADEEKKIFTLKPIANPRFLEDIHYTFVKASEFDELSCKYYKFYHDRFLDTSSYIAELPYLCENGAPR